MKLDEVGYRGEIVATYAAELRACKTHKALQDMIDERWPWLTDAGGLAHMLCRRTFYEFQQWLATDAEKRKDRFATKAHDEYWLAGVERWGSLVVPARLLGITMGAERYKVEDSLFLRRVLDAGLTDKFFAECDSQFGPAPKPALR